MTAQSLSPPATNVITIDVTAEDGSTTRTYTVTATATAMTIPCTVIQKTG